MNYVVQEWAVMGRVGMSRNIDTVRNFKLWLFWSDVSSKRILEYVNDPAF